MKKTTLIIGLGVLLTGLVACKCHKKKEENKTGNTSTTQQATNTGNQDPTLAAYDLKISFYSIGSGPDREAYIAYEKYYNDFSTKNNVEIPKLRKPWGREGEVDFYLDLSKLSVAQKMNFQADLLELLKGKQVHIKQLKN